MGSDGRQCVQQLSGETECWVDFTSVWQVGRANSLCMVYLRLSGRSRELWRLHYYTANLKIAHFSSKSARGHSALHSGWQFWGPVGSSLQASGSDLPQLCAVLLGAGLVWCFPPGARLCAQQPLCAVLSIRRWTVLSALGRCAGKSDE